MMRCINGSNKSRNTNYRSFAVLESDGPLHEDGKEKYGQRFRDMWNSCWVTRTCLLISVMHVFFFNVYLIISYLLQKNRKFYVTALIIPKQEGTANSVKCYQHIHFFSGIYEEVACRAG